MPEANLLSDNTPAITLQVPPSGEPAFTAAEILPGRGMMTLQVRARLPGLGEVDLLTAPSLEKAGEFFGADQGGFPGNASYLIGGAILLPYANRIRGKLSADGRTVTTRILGREVTLPANAGGRRAGAERYSMHGLILDSEVGAIERETTAEADILRGTLQAGDFGFGWPSSTEITFENVLRGRLVHPPGHGEERGRRDPADGDRLAPLFQPPERPAGAGAAACSRRGAGPW